jgi:hypothetical protein
VIEQRDILDFFSSSDYFRLPLKKISYQEKMNIQLSTLFCICIVLVIPLLVSSTSKRDLQENSNDDVDNEFDRFAKSIHRYRQPQRSSIYSDHYQLKKAADFEQILRPCNQIPATGRGQEYADCVRSRMLLMGRRK